jgi:hypothetical protein
MTEENVRDPDDQEPKRACPECGDDDHLYQLGADVKWKADTRCWVSSGEYDSIECTTCDWSGTEEETEMPDG